MFVTLLRDIYAQLAQELWVSDLNGEHQEHLSVARRKITCIYSSNNACRSMKLLELCWRIAIAASVRDRLGLGLGEPAALCTKQYCEIAEIVTS